ncbi:hypothetical protein [Roseomonas elaeocarpi]|uniref:Uncharacterized protein n=1 Tax=Roseomonas elaeocarpi TaxID=907779 RepID=A0ABV6JN09_9PROT
MRKMPDCSSTTHTMALDRSAQALPRAGRAYAARRNTGRDPEAEPSTTALSP